MVVVPLPHLIFTMRFACLLALTLLPVACGSPSIDAPVSEQTGAELFITQGCTTCHAKDGSGSFLGLGPDLRDKRKFWEVETMAEYMLDPAKFIVGHDRLGKTDKEMPALEADLETRTRIAEYVLTLMTE